jgi:hypothetical protein
MMLSAQALESECRVFTKFLLGCVPQAYAVRKYIYAHEMLPVFSSGNRFDHFLLCIARTHPVLAKLADSYARLFAPTALLRKKLVLLFAILETSAPSCQLIDAAKTGTNIALLSRVLIKGIVFVLSTAAAAVLFSPLQMIFAAREARRND